MVMKYRIDYITTFSADVSTVIANLEENPQKAKRIFEKLDRSLGKTVGMPEMYPIYEDFPIFRRIVIEEYLVFYTINKRDRIIEVHRIIYGRIDIKQQLTDTSDELPIAPFRDRN
jgi:plasmid stabilization system protein ParE